MRRALFRGVAALAQLGRCTTSSPFAQPFYFATDTREFLRQLKHRFVLLSDVPLEVRDLLLEASNAFVHRRDQISLPF